MKAVWVREPGGPEVLEIREVPPPRPQPREILVRVKAASVNRADILQRRGKYPPPPGASPILGLDIAGVVEARGPEARRWKQGDRVFGLIPGGGYAQYAVIHEDLAMPIPESMSFEEAAAIPEVFLTAYQALFWLGRLQPGEWVLIHAGASGVGTAAIQLAREHGAHVAVTAGSPRKLEACRALGAEIGVNYRQESFEKVIRERVGGVDLILDFVGAPYWRPNLAVLRLDGRLVLLATLGGGEVKGFDLRELLRKRLTLMGSTLRNRSLEYKIRLTREFAEYALPRFASGKLRPVIDTVFPWQRVADAHRRIEANENIGKIVLKID